ncbi:MAG TPA: hypothetical protein VML96_08530 [Egibacteraceae bacterium]|nr:hypothetical protein [Egibacteraceae bacterium]
MATLTAIYVDFQDLDSYRAWRWLSLLPERETVEVRPYSLDTDDQGERRSPWDRSMPTWGVELLALGEAARDLGKDVHLAFVDAAFAAAHDSSLDPASPEAWLALAADAGLDLETFIADGERWRAEVGLWHQEAEDELGVRGVPCMVFDDANALYVKLERDVDGPAAGERLLTDLADLAQQPVEEVRRTA